MVSSGMPRAMKDVGAKKEPPFPAAFES